MHLDEKRGLGRWWLCAGCAGFFIMSCFIAATLYLGEDRQTVIRPRFRQVVTRLPSPETPTYRPETLQPGPDPVSLDEMFPVKQNTVRKKSEAVYTWTEEPVSEIPQLIDEFPADFREDFRLPGITPPLRPVNVPPFQYIKEYEYEEPPENPMFTLLQKRLKDVYDLIGAKKLFNADWLDLIDSVNKSVHTKNVSIIVNQLRDMYYNTSAPELSLSNLIYPSRQSLLSNTSSLVSFGLLAIDLFLLHNVQQIALSDDDTAAQKMRDDPEVVALNALFMSPDKLKSLGRSQEDKDEGILQDVLEFARGAVTAVVNLGRAYKRTTSPVQGRSADPSPLDCIWTLYCRNLDKTSKLQGPYGFLAKMNR